MNVGIRFAVSAVVNTREMRAFMSDSNYALGKGRLISIMFSICALLNQKLTVLFAPINYVGPINTSIGLGEVLRDSGHRVVFATTNEWLQRLKSLNFEIELMTEESDKVTGDSADANVDEASDLLDNKSPLEKALRCMSLILRDYHMSAEKDEPSLKRIINAVKPDVIISDHVLTLPSIAGSGIPWIFSHSSNPLSLDFGYEDKRLPPSILGLSINSDKNLWEEYRQQLKNERKNDWFKYKDWLISNGCPVIPEELQFWAPSPFANIIYKGFLELMCLQSGNGF
ncbi:unnamed protein product [Medioppia subpectinata]|uniref:UDP-glycosyltransferase n=1 Tax=Medioppia subpectinata TaxID=1979941 RepID=A0A7R9KBQ9_9ACAR|nr:unnamed protein product [Medioppia subpectinata]CAG2100257.1 unnamed protein product [Medioppia subpectinata]